MFATRWDLIVVHLAGYTPGYSHYSGYAAQSWYDGEPLGFARAYHGLTFPGVAAFYARRSTLHECASSSVLRFKYV